MNEIDIKGLGYTYQSDGPEEDWALVYAREAIEAHCDSEVLDHPDGSVTREKIKSGAVSADKLSDDVIASIVAAQNTADSATVLANSAQQTADNATELAYTAQENIDIKVWPELETNKLHIQEVADRAAALEENMGDVETALDGIIAIQNSLMGVSE